VAPKDMPRLRKTLIELEKGLARYSTIIDSFTTNLNNQQTWWVFRELDRLERRASTQKVLRWVGPFPLSHGKRVWNGTNGFLS
jgi:hypothetical protein